MKTNINGDKVEFLADPRETLLDCLRDHIGLTGSKEGCGTGDCGACSCIFDGDLVSSCLVLGVEAEGKSIETIEGMAGEKELHPLQKKFIEMVENHEFPKLAKLSWRNSDLEFGSIKKLIDSLEKPSSSQFLRRKGNASDLVMLIEMSKSDEVKKYKYEEEIVLKLWEVCQIPDFANSFSDNHSNLLKKIFGFLIKGKIYGRSQIST